MRRYSAFKNAIAALITSALLLFSPTANAANSTVSAMTAASALSGTELFYCVQSAADRKCTGVQLAAYIFGTVSGDLTCTGLGACTVTKTNGVALTALATTAPGTGIATFLATPTSANLAAALTNETGSGAAVFGTSPTIGTPTINTPTINSPTIGTAMTLGFATGGGVQCVQVDNSGVVSGTAAGCGGGGGSGTVTSIATTCGASGGTITTTGTITGSVPLNLQTGANYAIVAGDCGKLVNLSNASNQTPTLPTAATFGANNFTEVCNIGAGTQTITPATSTIGGQSAFTLPAATALNPACVMIQSDGASPGNYNIVPDFTVNAGYLTAGTVNAARLPFGTGVGTAAAANLSAAGGLSSTIASGTSAMGTGAISSATCATVVTTTATNTATTDVVLWGFNGDPTAVTGYVPLTAGMLTIIAYPSSGNVNFKVCNNTTGSITPGAITLNWRIVR